MAQTVKHLPTMWETQVQSLGREDPLAKETATHSSILPGKSHGRRNLVGYSPWGGKELDTIKQFHFHFPMVRASCCHCEGPGFSTGLNPGIYQHSKKQKQQPKNTIS